MRLSELVAELQSVIHVHGDKTIVKLLNADSTYDLFDVQRAVITTVGIDTVSIVFVPGGQHEA